MEVGCGEGYGEVVSVGGHEAEEGGEGGGGGGRGGGRGGYNQHVIEVLLITEQTPIHLTAVKW